MPDNIIARHINDRQSTHSSAAQASAARLLLLLRKDFSKGEETRVSEDNIGVLERINFASKIKQDHIEKKENEAITGILQFIAYINSKPGEFEKEERKKVITRIAQMAKLGNDHWTKNQYYPDGAAEPVIIDSSLGETLNLVCLATFAKDAYKTQSEKDTSDRIRTLFNCLVQQSEGICSGGMQHELLFLLNGTYKGIRLIEDIDSFLHDTALQAIAGYLTTDFPNPEALFAFLKHWLDPDDTSNEHEAWLDGKKEAITELLTRQCGIYGLNPRETEKKITDFVINLTFMQIPSSLHSGIVIFREIFEFITNSHATSEFNAIRNSALQEVKKNVFESSKTLDDIENNFNGFTRALVASRELESSLYLTIFIGDEAQQLRSTRDELQAVLTNYFSRCIADKNFQLPGDFEDKYQKYAVQFKEFKKSNHTDFISNFFVVLKNLDTQASVYSLIDQLHQLEPSPTLTDETLNTWLDKYKAADGVIELSPYEINRILFHALLVSADEWTELYKKALKLVVDWLLESEQVTDASMNNLRALRAAYPKELLTNIKLLVYINASNDLDDAMKRALNQLLIRTNENELKEFKYKVFDNNLLFDLIFKTLANQYDQIFDVLPSVLERLIQDSDTLTEILNIREISRKRCDQIFSAVQDNLANIIHDGNQLVRLLLCKNLTEGQRTHVYRAVQDKLGDIIQDGDQLASLFDHTNLTHDQRTQIYIAVQDKLGVIIQNVDQLWRLVNCKNLTHDQRAQVCSAVQDKLGDIIQNGEQLARLLNSESLTEGQRAQIYIAVQDKLGDIIRQHGPDLIDLLYCKHLTESQRAQVLRAVQDKLGDIIQNAYQGLSYFLDCKYLTENQRDQIIVAAQDKLSEITSDRFELYRLINCQYLVENQRTHILNAMQYKLSDLIYDDKLFYDLLYSQQLTTNQCALILSAVQDNLIQHIQNDTQLLKFLNYRYLTENQRTQFLHNARDKLGNMVTDCFSLSMLLECECLTEHHRTQILDAVKDTFANTHIENGHLRYLLSSSGLTEHHRTQILDAMKNRLAEVISDNKNALALLECSFLTNSHKALILDKYLKQLLNQTNINEDEIVGFVKYKDLLREALLKKPDITADDLQKALDKNHPLGKIFSTHRGKFYSSLFPQAEISSIKLIEAKLAELQSQPPTIYPPKG